MRSVLALQCIEPRSDHKYCSAALVFATGAEREKSNMIQGVGPCIHSFNYSIQSGKWKRQKTDQDFRFASLSLPQLMTQDTSGETNSVHNNTCSEG